MRAIALAVCAGVGLATVFADEISDDAQGQNPQEGKVNCAEGFNLYGTDRDEYKSIFTIDTCRLANGMPTYWSNDNSQVAYYCEKEARWYISTLGHWYNDPTKMYGRCIGMIRTKVGENFSTGVVFEEEKYNQYHILTWLPGPNVSLVCAEGADASNGWYVSKSYGRNCDETCREENLICTAEAMNGHMDDVNSNEKMRKVMEDIGVTSNVSTDSCGIYTSEWSQRAAPMLAAWGCWHPSADRADDPEVCTRPWSGYYKQRMCYCHADKSLEGKVYVGHEQCAKQCEAASQPSITRCNENHITNGCGGVCGCGVYECKYCDCTVIPICLGEGDGSEPQPEECTEVVDAKMGGRDPSLPIPDCEPRADLQLPEAFLEYTQDVDCNKIEARFSSATKATYTCTSEGWTSSLDTCVDCGTVSSKQCKKMSKKTKECLYLTVGEEKVCQDPSVLDNLTCGDLIRDKAACKAKGCGWSGKADPACFVKPTKTRRRRRNRRAGGGGYGGYGYGG